MLEEKNFYLAHGKYNAELSQEIEKVATEVGQQEFENIFFAGAGGSISMLQPFVTIFKKLSTIPVYAEDAGELAVSDYRQLTQKSLVVVVSKTGTMIETVKVVERCIKEGISVVSFIGDPESPIAQQSTYSIYQDESINSFRYMPLYYFFFKLLAEKGDFDQYPKFKENMEKLAGVLHDVAATYEPNAKTFSETHGQDDFQLYIASGLAYPEAGRFAYCNLEEVFGIKTQVISSSEFFHGSFEIIDEKTPAVLIKGLDLSQLDQEFVSFFTPMICSTLFGVRTFKNLEKVTGKSFNTRNYYNVVDY